MIKYNDYVCEKYEKAVCLRLYTVPELHRRVSLTRADVEVEVG